MKKKTILKIVLGIVGLVVLLFLITIIFVGPWAEKKIRTALIENKSNYDVEIGKVRVSLFTLGLELKSLNIRTKEEHRAKGDLTAEIESIKFRVISLRKLLTNGDIDINKIIISNTVVHSIVPFVSDSAQQIIDSLQTPIDSIQPIISSANVKIGNILFDGVDISVKYDSTSQVLSLKEGEFEVYDLRISKLDTISSGILQNFDFKFTELHSVSADSMYSMTASGIEYSEDLKSIEVDSFLMQPNYDNYAFTSRKPFQSSRIEGTLSNIKAQDFSVAEYLRSGNLISSYVEIGSMNMEVFKDKRKPFEHKRKPTFQELIYDFPGLLSIDSLQVIRGDVVYKEHAFDANNPGYISFNKINARLKNIKNDTTLKTTNTFFELKAEALFMGTGNLHVLLKSELFEPYNTFTLDGFLSNMDANDINPILEKSAFLYATAGRIDKMSFSFSANDQNSTGSMTMLYHDLDLTMKNKETDDTTGFKERIISLIANFIVLESNPLPGNEIRPGTIYYERDPERFLFHYCFNSILSGIKTSLVNEKETVEEKETRKDAKKDAKTEKKVSKKNKKK